MTLDAKLRWKAHAKKEREELGLKYNKIYWLMGRRSALSIHNKPMLYKQILKPVWN
jgi:chorismate-pyruvate lyase